MNVVIVIMMVVVVLVVSFILFGQLISDARIRNLERDYSAIKQTLTNLEINQVDQCSSVFNKLENLESSVRSLQAFNNKSRHKKKNNS